VTEAATDALVSIPRLAAASVVYLRAEIPPKHPSAAILGEERMGAGVAVTPERVLTAHYLVLGASRLEVVGLDGRPRGVERLGLDHESGLALLTVDRPDLVPAPLAANGVRPGQPIFMVTCTGDRERRGASGHVTSVAPFEAFWEYMLDRAIMTTILNPGLAGGPLLDTQARVVGIVSLGLTAVGRYSLAIPIDLFHARRTVLESDQPVPVEERRAWIGFYPQGQDDGITIVGIVPGSPADQAGLQKGDWILTVDGQSVSNLRGLYQTLWKKGPGEPVRMQILREEAIHVVEVVAGDRYEFYR
jgi:S1-C subfamily serine protease